MKHDPILHPHREGDDVALFAQRRKAIDLIATSRARAIRSALFGAYLFRKHPTRTEDADTRANWLRILNEQADALARATALVNGRDPNRDIPDEVCQWIGTHGKNRPRDVAAFTRMRDLTRDLCDAAASDDINALERALTVHFTVGRGGFFEMVTSFCDGMWADLDSQRHAEVDKAAATGTAITKTLTRLEHIGKHVRLVSLNASVEAARVGDAGRGLGVIAVEFKTLAEEIQMLATTARNDIAAMTHATRQTARDVVKSPT
ncbi:methyl-accepting chemotaxis protein [uncultured Tateyamaria sp.]|uniref:methyl-accepting chemotaxis protein n=1 Tax=uncultured Tateyamaria sp. TaxID=455651 RepID=UPI00262A51E8|nr:methyl-accepting chemotaxis protein [uncultured Tateyamaria sp.]